jgi:hypothetical protein
MFGGQYRFRHLGKGGLGSHGKRFGLHGYTQNI